MNRRLHREGRIIISLLHRAVPLLSRQEGKKQTLSHAFILLNVDTSPYALVHLVSNKWFMGFHTSDSLTWVPNFPTQWTQLIPRNEAGGQLHPISLPSSLGAPISMSL